MIKKPLGLYLHIPFCNSKCAYCDFYSIPSAGEEFMRRYSDALILQMEDYSKAAKGYKIDSIFVGGGTPTVLPVKCMSNIIDAVYRNFDVDHKAEFTMESNPATVSLATLSKYRRAGVNRLSIGLQSADDSELRQLSRIHNRTEFEAAYASARKAGFDNINIDIMYGIPLQTSDSFNSTLNYVTSLDPEHISMYGLKIEEGTPFYKNRDTLTLPDEDTEAEMYFDGISHLQAKGYNHYEISNFARPGFECRHNLKYWNCREYLGLGPAAHSYFADHRFSFKRDMGLYVDTLETNAENGITDNDGSKLLDFEEYQRTVLTDEMYTISPKERIGEYIMLRLRLTEGISAYDFKKNFGIDFDNAYGKRLGIYVDNGFMRHEYGRYFFTPKGMYVSNYILSSILDFDEDSRIVGAVFGEIEG